MMSATLFIFYNPTVLLRRRPRHRTPGPYSRVVLQMGLDFLEQLSPDHRTWVTQDTNWCHTVSLFTAFSPNRIGEYDTTGVQLL